MAVTLTSPVLGQEPGFVYTGTLEDWLLAQGYARRDGYTGPGVQQSGSTDVAPANDPTLASNRDEKPSWPATKSNNWTIANDADNLNKKKFPLVGFDFDAGGVDDDPPSNVALNPAEGPAAGGTVITVTGDNLEGVTAVNFGATAGTALDVTEAANGSIQVTTPPGTAGAVDVTLVDASGNTTLTGGFTYTA